MVRVKPIIFIEKTEKVAFAQESRCGNDAMAYESIFPGRIRQFYHIDVVLTDLMTEHEGIEPGRVNTHEVDIVDQRLWGEAEIHEDIASFRTSSRLGVLLIHVRFWG